MKRLTQLLMVLGLTLLSSVSPLVASIWTGTADTYFTNAPNWNPSFPASAENIELGATATVDLTDWNASFPGGYYGLGALTFNSSAGAEILGNNGTLTLGGDIIQSGNGEITNTEVAYVLTGGAPSLKGTGTGKVNFNGIANGITSSSAITIDGGYYVFRGASGGVPPYKFLNNFPGLAVNSGGTLALTVLDGDLVLDATPNPSAVGTGQWVTNNGGTMIFGSEATSAGYLGAWQDRGLQFTKAGGQAIWLRKGNQGGPARYIFDTTNGVPAVLVGTGWAVDLPNSDRGLLLGRTSGNGSCYGTGDVLMIVTNGANGYIAGNANNPTLAYGEFYKDPASPLTNVQNRIPIKLTVAGPSDGDPDANQTSTSVGWFLTGNWGDSWDETYHTNKGNVQVVMRGIFTRGVLHFYQRNTNPRFLASDITVEDGTTTFAGGGAAGSSSRILYLGKDSATKLTIKDGATAVLNQNIRSDATSQGVRLNSTTDIEAGGTLKVKKTQPGAGHPIVITGPIVGKGAPGKESVFDINLPWAKEVNSLRDPTYCADPVTTFPTAQSSGGTLLDDWTSPNNSTGVKFYPGYANLVVNGTSALNGLRVQGYSEYLTNLLTAARLNAVTGSGGTLTIAVTNNGSLAILAGPSAASSVALGLDSHNGSTPTYNLAAAATMANYAGLVLKGGTAAIGDASTVSMKTLNLAGASATLQMGGAGASASVVNFTDSSAVAWVGTTLNIANWSGNVYGGGSDRVYVGTTGSGLTAAQLAKVKWINPFGSGDVTGAYALSSGEIVPAVGQSQFVAGSIVPPNVATSTPFSATVNGQAGTSYRVLASSDVSLPLGSWTQIATGTGTFTFNDPASLTNPIRFYIVLTP